MTPSSYNTGHSDGSHGRPPDPERLTDWDYMDSYDDGREQYERTEHFPTELALDCRPELLIEIK